MECSIQPVSKIISQGKFRKIHWNLYC